jgi:rare lipoprotein A (peptidoglycan hydrolase)
MFLIGLLGLAALIPCIAQQTEMQAVEGNATWYESEDTVSYASHATLPFGTQVIVTNLENNQTAIVQIGGRIPKDPRWIIDICSAAADALELNMEGFTKVRIEMAPKVAKRKAFRKFMQMGPASWQLDGMEFIAAHPSLPLNSLVRITNKANGKQEIATVVRRVPASQDRIVDLSRSLARKIGLPGSPGEVLLESVDKDTGK